jgi:L-lactate dehydrogenase (cytochrome)
MDAVRIVPRYGVDVDQVSTGVTLFGRPYAMPVGVAPMGNVAVLRAGIDEMLARAAQRARIPYVSSTVANAPLERLAALAPDVFWFQLYGAPARDHAVSVDLIRRAEAAGAHALLLTVDVPRRQKRVHDIRNGFVLPFRLRPRTLLDIAGAPLWALEVLRRGQPRFGNFEPYAGAASPGATAAYVQENMQGALTWEAIARFRDLWPRALVVKGIMHPEDAARAVALGVDGIQVSNHGGRQLDAAPAAIDMVPAIAERVGGRATLLLDGSVRSGLDVLRALAVGVQATLAGRAFLWGATALGEAGADHVAAMFREEIAGVFAQAGVRSVAEAASATVLHPGAVRLPPAAERAAPAAGRRLDPVDAA